MLDVRCFSTFLFSFFHPFMQRIVSLSLALVLVAAMAGHAQTSSCCTSAPHAQTLKAVSPKPVKTASKAPVRFASLVKDKNFQMMHDEPLPFALADAKGTVVKVKAADGSDCMGYEVKAAKPSKNVIFMVHEWWGLNDHIKQEADILSAELGVTVIALDLYDGTVATTREDAMKAVRALKPERAQAITQAFAKYAGADAKIGTIGWCMGGMYSLQGALTLGKQAVACVMYYGTPELDPKRLATLSAPVLGIFGKQDQGIKPETVEKFQAAMKEIGKPVEIKMYDAGHAFANPSNPNFNKAFTEEAHKLTVEFFKKHLM
jgi:carboxymethylenebutenolidase